MSRLDLRCVDAIAIHDVRDDEDVLGSCVVQHGAEPGDHPEELYDHLAVVGLIYADSPFSACR